ncbi:recombinase family protein [Vibrio breoganii]
MATKIYKNTRVVKSVPFHCEVEGDIIHAPYTDIVQRMFELRLKGLGAPAIASKLNEEFSAPNSIRTGEFTNHFVHRLLKSRSVLGELHIKGGEVIKNYFPPAIDEATFDKVNSTRLFTTGVTSAKGTTNVFKGVTFCKACSNGVVVKTSNSKYKALNCVKRGKGCSVSSSVRVYDVLPALLNDMVLDPWVTEVFTDSKRSQEIIESTTETQKALQAELKTAYSKKTVQAIIESIEYLEHKINYHKILLKGGFSHILDSFDFSTLEGRKLFTFTLDIIYSNVTVNFDSGIINVAHRHTGKKYRIKTTNLDSRVWKIKGLEQILFKDGANLPDEFINNLKAPS